MRQPRGDGSSHQRVGNGTTQCRRGVSRLSGRCRRRRLRRGRRDPKPTLPAQYRTRNRRCWTASRPGAHGQYLLPLSYTEQVLQDMALQLSRAGVRLSGARLTLSLQRATAALDPKQSSAHRDLNGSDNRVEYWPRFSALQRGGPSLNGLCGSKPEHLRRVLMPRAVCLALRERRLE